MNAQDQSIKDIMNERIKGLLRKPAQAQKEKRPHNKLWIASVGFNATMFFLDFVSAVTVAILTNVMYGVMTFLAGFLALLLHENLFTNAHADRSQKNIAIGGGVLAIVSTVAIGVLAGIVNVTNIVGLLPTLSLEVGIVISLVGVAGIHGVLWGIYFFMDEGHQTAMKVNSNMAYRERQRQQFDDAKKDILAVKEIAKELDAMGDDADLIGEAYRENTGKDLINASQPAPALADQLFMRKEAEAGNSFRPDGEVQS
jgi:hypothetical protein